jgi:adenosylhomocysteine nucleosidase
MNHAPPIGVVAALSAEARSCAAWREFGAVELVIAGPGPLRAAAAAQRLVAAGVRELVSWGTSGALSEHLKPGQLLLLKETCDTNGQRYPADAQLLQRFSHRLATLSPLPVVAVTLATPVLHQHEKRALAQRHHCAAVDMESAAVAQVACAAQLPFLAVRSIVDPLDFDIPTAAMAGMSEDGEPQPSAVMKALLMRPRDVLAVIRLGLHYRTALTTLARAAGLLGRKEIAR